MDEKITSRENAKIKYACRLSSSAAFRRSEGRFLAEGRKLCPELARGAQLETLFYTESAMAKCPELAGLPGEHYLVEDHVADKLADVGTHQGVFGVFRTPVHTLDEVKTGGRYLALERVQDPGKCGHLLRSAAAFGFDGVILSDGCANVYAPKDPARFHGCGSTHPGDRSRCHARCHHPAARKGYHLPCCRAVQVSAAERGAGKLPRRRLRRHRQRGAGPDR